MDAHKIATFYPDTSWENHTKKASKTYFNSSQALFKLNMGRKQATPDYNLLVLYPNIAREFHPTKNHNVDPVRLTPSSFQKLWWKCEYCSKEWQARCADRTRNKGNGTRCPKCARSFCSKLQLLIFAELKYIFPDAELGAEINGVELDILLPSIRIGVEIDGARWHSTRLDLKNGILISEMILYVGVGSRKNCKQL